MAGLAYLGVVIAGDWERIRGAIRDIGYWSVLLASLVATAMFLLKAFYHALICRRLAGSIAGICRVITAYCMAQLIRYLPGKIWGVVFQSTHLADVLPARVVITANIVQTINTNAMGMGIIISILSAGYLQSLWPLLGIAAAMMITEALHRYPKFDDWIMRLLRRFSKSGGELPDRIPLQRSSGTIILFIEWVLYFLVWVVLLGNDMALTGIVLVATWYAAASLLAIMALVIPAGIVVREAMFVALASFTGVEEPTLVALAIVLRFTLSLGELLSVPLSILITRTLNGKD